MSHGILSVDSCAYWGLLGLGADPHSQMKCPADNPALPNRNPAFSHTNSSLFPPLLEVKVSVFCSSLRPGCTFGLLHIPPIVRLTCFLQPRTINLMLATHSWDFKEPSKHPIPSPSQWPLVATVARETCPGTLHVLWTLIPLLLQSHEDFRVSFCPSLA